jgi:hypothetical protein
MSLIVANDKDRRCLDWLEARFTGEQIADAVTQVEASGRKAYLSNITKHLQTRIPDEVWGMQPEEFEAVKTKLKSLRDEFAAKAASKV